MAIKKMLILSLTLILYSTMMTAPSQATILYDFTNGMGSNFSFQNPTGLFSLNDSNGYLRISKNIDAVDGILKLGRIRGNFLIGGDFDIEVDYRLFSPLNLGDQLEFQIYSSNFNFFISRSNELNHGGSNYHIFINGSMFPAPIMDPIPGIPTQDMAGTLRFIRSVDRITAYYRSDGETNYNIIYSGIFDANNVRVGMVLQNQPYSHSALDASFDNLRITAQYVSPPSTPTPVGFSAQWLVITFAALMIAGGGLLRRRMAQGRG